jgi:predicted nucleic acid-binding protein
VTAAFVVDASIGLAWFMPSQGTVETDRLLEAIAEGATPVVPALWPLEVLNACLVLLRRKRIRKEHFDAALSALQRLAVEVDTDGARQAWTTVAQLAREHRLSAYDAAYLELAQRRRLRLCTRDAALLKAAEACGIPTR